MLTLLLLLVAAPAAVVARLGAPGVDISQVDISGCDWQCYLDRYRDLGIALGANNTEAAQHHFLYGGYWEGRKCGCVDISEVNISGCDWQCYLDRYRDLGIALGATNTEAAQHHFLYGGYWEGRKCGCVDISEVDTSGCDWQCYLDRYDDLADAFGANNTEAAQHHFLYGGYWAGRKCGCEPAPTPATPSPTLATTLSYICDQSSNFVNGAQYDQISLTSACPNCSSNPVYGPPNSVDEAVAWCKSQCDQRSSCSGFFFQRHMNGHEICGFYTGFDPVDASAKAWHGHAGGSQLCAKVPV